MTTTHEPATRDAAAGGPVPPEPTPPGAATHDPAPRRRAPHTAAPSAAAPDSGLLSPVRAGTPVEAAVGDTAWLQAMLDAEAALARAQARCGTVPPDAAAQITAAARAEYLDVRGLALAARETANPVVGLVTEFTAVVARRSPAAAEYVHRGSTSQDIFDTGAMLVAARALRLIVADLRATAAALATLAAEHRDTAMPGRTLALHAVPTTFGLKAAGWRHLVLDAAERLERVADGGLPVSLGGAAGTLAGYLQHAGDGADPAVVLDRLVTAFADETALAAPVLPWHALRTPVADLGAALAHTAGALGKIAVDVQVLARTEIGETAEPAVAGRGASSAMPHKRNPVLATLIRSAALQVPALTVVLTQCLTTEDERSGGVWHAEWQPLREALRLTGGAAHTAVELARGLTVHPRRMRANLTATGGQIVSERVCAVLTPRLGKAAARHLLTDASRRAAETGRPLADVLAERPQLHGMFTRDELAALLDPLRYTGAAGPLVDRALADPRHPERSHPMTLTHPPAGPTLPAGPGPCRHTPACPAASGTHTR
ncbi:3-carboxy-cis,cis-muconate cycloisomerase [Streptomyces flavidovirens]|uniref:3-carboxy-cis,cis-muconate cycloisomerase n=1 Tax=Streptomyces flavidovirens TaxID=67298 RepID=UPI0034419A70